MRRILKWSLPILLVIIAMTCFWRFTLRCSGPAKDDGGERILSELANAKPLDTVDVVSAGLSFPSNIEKAASSRTLRFLELAHGFLSESDYEALDESAHGEGIVLPDNFSGLSSLFLEMLSKMVKAGTLGAYCKLLSEEHRERPSDIDVLRILVLVSSVQESGASRAEHEKWLEELYRMDSRQDVAWPLAEVFFRREDYRSACDVLFQTADRHPEQASQVLTQGLGRLAAKKEVEGYAEIVRRIESLESLQDIDSQACADILLKAGELDGAARFYERCLRDGKSRFRKELCRLGLADIAIRRGEHVDVPELQRLAMEGSTSAARMQARRLLIGLNAEIPGQRDNSNTKR